MQGTGPSHQADDNGRILSSGGEHAAPELAAQGAPAAECTRIDRWLCAARLFKSRNQAQAACEAGHVAVNGNTVKPSKTVQAGDKITARAPRGLVVVQVLAIEGKRQGAVRARELYEDHSPPPVDRDVGMGLRPRGYGRPTKADRRAIARLRGLDSDE
jgi:ribosome-associated heat shock protein Hsp15